MLILRIVVLLSALLIVLSGGLYLFTRQTAYLRFAWQVVRFDFILLVIFGGLFLLERYVLAGWGVLL